MRSCSFRETARSRFSAIVAVVFGSVLLSVARGFAQDATDGFAGQNPAPPVTIELSDAYEMRAKIHKIASFATLPLLATELALGQSLYNDTQGSSPGMRKAHSAVGVGIGGLFAVNSVTGVWNLVEAWKAPEHRKKRLLHGVLMLAADGGFFATAVTAPDHERIGTSDGKQTHRAIAFTAIGAATAGYLIMLVGDH